LDINNKNNRGNFNNIPEHNFGCIGVGINNNTDFMLNGVLNEIANYNKNNSLLIATIIIITIIKEIIMMIKFFIIHILLELLLFLFI
jgi:hypothetical protein